MLEKMVEAMVDALERADISAAPAYVKTEVDPCVGFVRIGVKRAKDACGGFAQYLGLEKNAAQGERELYGMMCETEVSLDVYAPVQGNNGALDCLAMFDSAALVISAMEGLVLTEISCGGAAPDRETGMFRLTGSAVCKAWLVAEAAEETGGFTDFILKGELKK